MKTSPILLFFKHRNVVVIKERSLRLIFPDEKRMRNVIACLKGDGYKIFTVGVPAAPKYQTGLLNNKPFILNIVVKRNLTWSRQTALEDATLLEFLFVQFLLFVGFSVFRGGFVFIALPPLTICQVSSQVFCSFWTGAVHQDLLSDGNVLYLCWSVGSHWKWSDLKRGTKFLIVFNFN